MRPAKLTEGQSFKDKMIYSCLVLDAIEIVHLGFWHFRHICKFACPNRFFGLFPLNSVVYHDHCQITSTRWHLFAIWLLPKGLSYIGSFVVMECTSGTPKQRYAMYTYFNRNEASLLYSIMTFYNRIWVPLDCWSLCSLEAHRISKKKSFDFISYQTKALIKHCQIVWIIN